MKCERCGVEFFSQSELSVSICSRCLIRSSMGSLLEQNKTIPSMRALTGSSNQSNYADRDELQSIFPEFEFQDRLGAGGMGAVFKARQKSLDRMVAIKILNPKLAEEPEFQERFEREAKAMAMLNHPNIVSIHDFGVREGFHYLIMEYVDGCDLHKLIRAGEVNEELAFSVITQTCEALHFAHENGVVHRDVKPGNIFIGKNGVAKVGDFGIARIVENHVDNSLTLTGVGMGTPSYMAPEQLADAKTIDARADIYALGVVIYQMLTGKMPAGNFSPPTSRLPRRNKLLDRAILKAMESDPGKRMSDVKDISRALGEIEKSKKPDKGKVEFRIFPHLFFVLLFFLVMSVGWYIWPNWKLGSDLTKGITPSIANRVEPEKRMPFEDSLGMKFVPVPIEMLLPPVGSKVNKNFDVARRRGGILRKWESKAEALDISAAEGIDNLVSLKRLPHFWHGWFGARVDGEMLASAKNWDDRNDYLEVTRSFWIERPNRLVSVKKSDPAFIQLPKGVSQAVDLASSTWGSIIITPEGRAIVAAKESWRKNNLPIVQRIEALEHAVSVEGFYPAMSIRMANGDVLSWHDSGVFLNPPKNHRPYVQVSPGGSHVIALCDEGTVETWSSPQFAQNERVALALQIPSDLGPIIRVLASGNVSAAQRPDGSWLAWGSDNGIGLIDAINSIGPALDVLMRFTINKGGAKLLWIEAVDYDGGNTSQQFPRETEQKTETKKISLEALIPSVLLGVSEEFAALRRQGGILKKWSEKPGLIDIIASSGIDDLVSVNAAPYIAMSWYAARANGEMVSSVPGLTQRNDYRSAFHSFSIEWPDELVPLEQSNRAFLPLLTPIKRVMNMAQTTEVAVIVTPERRVVLAAKDPWIKSHQYVINRIKNLENAESVDSWGRTISILTAEGRVVSWKDPHGLFESPEDSRRIVQVAPGREHVLGLYEDGTLISWAHPKSQNHSRIGSVLQIPSNIGPVIRIKAYDFTNAVQRPDGSWFAWGDDRGRGIIEQINSIGPAIDMELFHVNESTGAKMVWIEPAPIKKEKSSPSPVEASEPAQDATK